jgi:hypothetical protein
MNERIKQLAVEANGEFYTGFAGSPNSVKFTEEEFQNFSESIVQECASICEEMSAKCAGIPGDGALAQDCANYIRQDFGVE